MATRYKVKCPVFLEEGEMNVTSPFGYRTSPSTGKRTMHKGVDLTRWAGYSALATITAFEDGVVRYVFDKVPGVDHDSDENSAGNYVVITHADGYVTKYFHLKHKSITVKKGDAVRKGDVIGYMGNTGNSYGAHLHFQLELNGTPIDGLPYLLGEDYIIEPPKEETEENMAEIKRYRTIEETPEALRAETQELIDSGALKGRGDESGLDVTDDMLRSLIIAKRYTDTAIAKAFEV